MPGIARVGDDVGGGTILNGNTSVLCNGLPVATAGSQISAHPCCGNPGCDSHCAARLVSGSSSVFVGGVSMARAGDPASCGHTATGSNTVICG